MKIIPIIQIGIGGVGRELIEQVLAARETLAARYGIALTYLALADSSGAVGGTAPLSSETIQAVVAHKSAGGNLAAWPTGRSLPHWIELLPTEPAIIVDVTAASGHEAPLAQAISAGHRVVLANKKPLSASWSHFTALVASGATRYEATAGAGLPILSTLQGLLDSGDTLIKVEAAMSGTLGYLCSELEAGTPLSTAVRAAHQLGYTEPDPRDDLSGTDVARKALILARSAGFAWELSDIPAEPWFSPELADISRDGFMARLEELDAPFAQRVATAKAEGSALRYAATISPQGANVGFQVLPVSHPLASLRGPDNLFSFTTARYPDRPLVIRGPGAGQGVTAAGVLADIIATGREM